MDTFEITPRQGADRDLVKGATVSITHQGTLTSYSLTEYSGAKAGTYYRANVPYGVYDIYVDGTKIKDNHPFGIDRVYTYIETLDPDGNNEVDGNQLKDDSVGQVKLTQALIDYINASGGGSITNNPDGIYLDTNGSSQITFHSSQIERLDGYDDDLYGDSSAPTQIEIKGLLQHALNNNFINSKDYGAVLDGVTDDKTSIRSTINAALADSRSILINGYPFSSDTYDGLDAHFFWDPFLRFNKAFNKARVTKPFPADQFDLKILKKTPRSYIYLYEISSSRFEILIPDYKEGYYTVYRFDNSHSNFSDGRTDLTRPFINTLISRSEITNYVTYTSASSEVTYTGTWITSGDYQYSNTTSDDITVSFTGHKARITYLATTNAGIMDIYIDNIKHATVDCYGSGSSTDYYIEGLTSGAHTLKIVVTGTKNASSSDYRVYIHNDYVCREYKELSDAYYYNTSGSYITSNVTSGYYKHTNSANSYAISCHPSGGTDEWVGDVHGEEVRDGINLYLDYDTITDIGTGTRLISSKCIDIVQTSHLIHSYDDGTIANVTITHRFTNEGYTQSYEIELSKQIYIANGYTQMFMVNGALQGGVSGDPNGWADRVWLKNAGVFDILAGSGSYFGNVLTNEIIFFGTEKDSGTQPNRYDDADYYAVYINFPYFEKSFYGIDNKTSFRDGVWVDDGTSKKKLYMQSLHLADNLSSGTKIFGKMFIKCIYDNIVGKMLTSD